MRVFFFAQLKDATGCNAVELAGASPLNTAQLWAELLQRFPALAAIAPMSGWRGIGNMRPMRFLPTKTRLHSFRRFPAAESFCAWKLKSNLPTGPSRKRFYRRGSLARPRG